jgi:hypothetical protein
MSSRIMNSSTRVAVAVAVTLSTGTFVAGFSQATPRTTDATRVAEEAFEALDRGDWAAFLDNVRRTDLAAFRETWEPVVRQVERRSPVPALIPELGVDVDADRAFVRHFMSTYTSPGTATGETFMRHRVIGTIEPDLNTAYVVYERVGVAPNGSMSIILVVPLIAERGAWRIRLTDDLMRVNELLCVR